MLRAREKALGDASVYLGRCADVQKSSLRLGYFSPSVVLGVAAATGALDRAGLDIAEIPVRSSAHQFSLLLSGEVDAVLTSPDNVIAYRDGAANPSESASDVRILAAVDRGLGLSLFAGPGVDPGAGLRGRTLGVDVPTSGFAFAAYELLARAGLAKGVDYRLEALGSTPMRVTALVAGDCAMTMLNAGSDLRAEAAGCTRVSRVSELGPYVATVLAARGDRVENDSGALRSLTAVVSATSRALCDGQFGEVAVSVATARLGLADEDVARYVQGLADPDEGLVPDGRLDEPSLQTLLRLRDRHADATKQENRGTARLGMVDERFLAPPE